MAYLNSITKIIKQIQDSDEKTRDRYNYHRGLSLHMIKKLMGADQSQWVYINNALKSGVDKGKLIKTGGKYRVVVTKKKSRKRRSVKRKTSRKRRSAKRKVSRKRRSVKRKTSRKRRSAKQKMSRCIEECMKDSKKRKTSRKRRSAKRKGKKKLKFRNGEKVFIDSYFKQNSGPNVSGVLIENLIDKYKTGKSFSGNQILSSLYRGLEIIKPDPEDLCKHPEIFIDFIYRLQKEMHDSLLESALDSLEMEKLYRKLETLYEKCKSKKKFGMSKKKSRKRRSVKRKVSRKRRSVKRKVSRKRRSVKRKNKFRIFLRKGEEIIKAENLHEAIEMGDTQQVVKFLENPNTDVNALDGEGVTPLMMAIMDVGHRGITSQRTPGIINMLINFVDLNAKDRDWGRTALHWAVQLDRLEAVEKLLQQPGIDPTIKNKSGLTPLDMALKLKVMNQFLKVYFKFNNTGAYLTMRFNEKPEEAARKFCDEHGLDHSNVEPIAQELRKRLPSVKASMEANAKIIRKLKNKLREA